MTPKKLAACELLHPRKPTIMEAWRTQIRDCAQYNLAPLSYRQMVRLAKLPPAQLQTMAQLPKLTVCRPARLA